MPDSHPHWLRSAIIAGIGLLIAIVSIVWIGVAIRSAGPETLSLSYRIDRKQTLAFARTKNDEGLRTAIKRLASVFGETNITDLQSLPKGISYEVALIASDGSTHEWIVETHLKNQQEKLIASAGGQSLLLPLTSIKQSLGASPFFRNHEKNANEDLLYANLADIPALSSSGSGLFRASLTPFASVLMLQKSALEQEWMFEKKETSLFTANGRLPSFKTAGDHPLFALSASNPPAIFGRLRDTLAVQNPSLLEGLSGIGRERLQRMTHDTDLGGALHDLLNKGGNIEILSGTGGNRFLIQGMTADRATLGTWIEKLRSAATPVLIRSQVFLHGDRRTDVIAAPEGSIVTNVNGWETMSIGSGSALQLTVATKGSTMLLSNETAMLQTALQRENPSALPSPAENKGMFAGEVNVRWLLSAVRDGIPMTENEVSLLTSMIDTNAFLVHFRARDERDAVNVQLSIEQ